MPRPSQHRSRTERRPMLHVTPGDDLQATIDAAPGGVLLLVALAKVLPFDLLPSAFREDDGNHAEKES